MEISRSNFEKQFVCKIVYMYKDYTMWLSCYDGVSLIVQGDNINKPKGELFKEFAKMQSEILKEVVASDNSVIMRFKESNDLVSFMCMLLQFQKEDIKSINIQKVVN